MNFQDRISEAKELLSEKDASAAVISPGPNMKYLGLTIDENAPVLLVIREEEKPLIAAHEAYEPKIDARFEYETYFEEDFEGVLEAAAKEISSGKILLDDKMWEKYSSIVRDALGDCSFGLAGEVMDELRKRKDGEEKDAIREASRITDSAVEKVRELGEDAIGMTEVELACKIDKWLKEGGGEENAFPTIVASGPNSANMHHEPGTRTIKEGEPVVLDFGTKVSGYASDQTRTLVFGGEPSEKFKKVFQVVKEAQGKGLEAVRAGTPASEAHESVTEVIGSAGYEDNFIHSTGHGVGIEVHENPGIGESSEDELEKDMAVTIEPGIYLEGELGVRIEDLVIVTEDGYERLNRTPRGWKL